MRCRAALLASAVALSAIALGAEETPPPAPAKKFLTLKDAFFMAALSPVWSLHFETSHADYAPKERTVLIEEFLSSLSETSDHPVRSLQLELGRKYKDAIVAIVRAAPTITGDGKIVILGDGNQLVRFAEQDGMPCAIFPGLAVGTIYNTLKLEAKERALKTATTVGLPFLVAASKTVKNTDLSCIGVGITFGSKNFASKEVFAVKSEYVGLAGSVSDIAAFDAGDLADEDLLGKLAVFSKPREVVADLNRIRLGPIRE